MSYECIYCGAGLTYEDTWGAGPYWICNNDPEGEIYRCPNHNGFDTEEVALEYVVDFGADPYEGSWEDVVCDSSCHHVSGMFHTDRSGELKEDYPC